jgi:hypothetical protein
MAQKEKATVREWLSHVDGDPAQNCAGQSNKAAYNG